MSNNQDAKRYQALRAYARAVRDWFEAHPDHQPGQRYDGEVRPWFAMGVIIALSPEDLDAVCDQHVAERSFERETIGY